MDNMSIKKKALARRIEQYDNSLSRAKDANMHNICMMWLHKKNGLEEAFEIIFGQSYIDYWMEETESEE